MRLDAAKASRFGEEDSRLNFDVLNVAIFSFTFRNITGRLQQEENCAFQVDEKGKDVFIKIYKPNI